VFLIEYYKSIIIPIPYTFSLLSIIPSAKRVLHYIFKKNLERKKLNKIELKTAFYPSKVT